MESTGLCFVVKSTQHRLNQQYKNNKQQHQANGQSTQGMADNLLCRRSSSTRRVSSKRWRELRLVSVGHGQLQGVMSVHMKVN